MSHSLLLWIIPVGVSFVAAAIDFRTGRIPNWLTMPAIVFGLLEACALHGGAGFVRGLVGVLVCAAVPWMLHRGTAGQGIGGGDVKLFAALGAFAGASLGLEIELSAFTLLAVFAVVRLTFQGHLLNVLGNVARIIARPFRGSRVSVPLATAGLTEMRMGPAIALAVLAVAISEQLATRLPWLI